MKIPLMLPVLLAHRLRALLFILTVSILFSGCVVQQNPVTGNKRAYGYTWEQERQIGQEADQQIIAQYGVYDDPSMTAYVERVGQEVLAESHLRRPDTDPEFRNTPFTFRVLDSPVVNAFALPGGYVYVTRGLLTHLNNEAQLAVVLGHEVGHVAARHASKRAASQQFGQIGLITGAILGEQILGSGAGQTILDLGGTAAQLLFLSYGRDDERESDALGVEYAALAGYNASQGAAFFRSLERLGEQTGGGIPSFLSTHPDPGEREERIPQLAAEWEPLTPENEIGQQELYTRLENTVLGQNPRQGFIRNGIFYHPELRFQFPVPSGYMVDNQASQVVIVEPNQQAVLVFGLAQGVGSAREATSQLVSQEGITVVESGATTASGYPAYFALADAPLQDGTVVRLLSYNIEYSNQVYTFLGYSAKANFSSYSDAFQRTMRGFDRVTDSSIINVQPARLHIVPASRTAAFSTFVPSALPEAMTARELAILNQVELEETIQRGTPLKLPR